MAAKQTTSRKRDVTPSAHTYPVVDMPAALAAYILRYKIAKEA